MQSFSLLLNFNSQPHKEADDMHAALAYATEVISTHSLTRRLTMQTMIMALANQISTHSLTRRLTNLRKKGGHRT